MEYVHKVWTILGMMVSEMVRELCLMWWKLSMILWVLGAMDFVKCFSVSIMEVGAFVDKNLELSVLVGFRYGSEIGGKF